MMKVTVLYGHPKSPDDFESYYGGTHLPLAAKMTGVERIELTKLVGAPGGQAAEYYRMAEMYFASQADMEQTLGSPEGQAAVADIENFSTGGVTIMIGSVDA